MAATQNRDMGSGSIPKLLAQLALPAVVAQVVNLLQKLQREMGLSLIFIAHDLAIVRRLCDRVAVMYLGRIVEEGPAEAVFTRPLHPYTAALVSAIPEIDPDKPLPKNVLGGEPPSPVAVPQGCAFHPRCPYAQAQCRTGAPPPTRQIADRAYACVLNLAGDETVFPLTGGSIDEAQAG